MPWQAMQVADLACPASTEPAANAGDAAAEDGHQRQGGEELRGHKTTPNDRGRQAQNCTLTPLAERPSAQRPMSAFPQVRFLTSAHQPRQFPPDAGAEVAVAGRSNAGKSSAINAIVQRKGLAKTSKTPGATRLINFFEIEPGRRLVDLPGYGFAAVPGDDAPALGRADRGLFPAARVPARGDRRHGRPPPAHGARPDDAEPRPAHGPCPSTSCSPRPTSSVGGAGRRP